MHLARFLMGLDEKNRATEPRTPDPDRYTHAMPEILRVALPVPLPQLFDYLPPARGRAVVGALTVAVRAETAPPEPGSEPWALTERGRTELREGKRRGRSRALLERLRDGLCMAHVLGAELPSWRDAARRLARAELVERHQ